MIPIKKTPLDIIDDIYNLAFWMTGNEQASSELVSCTYINADSDAPEEELLKTFRNCYIDTYGQQSDLEITDRSGSFSGLVESFRQWTADIKLSVLMSELNGLKHGQIAGIIDKPVETVRLWLFWGRKFFANDAHLKATA